MNLTSDFDPAFDRLISLISSANVLTACNILSCAIVLPLTTSISRQQKQPVKINNMKVSIDSVTSLAIQSEYRQAHCRHAEYFGSFCHPQHPDSQDWTIHLYEVCDALVFATNGDAIWQQFHHEAFDSLLKSYGIDLPAILIENSADEDGTLHDYQSGEAIRPATPAEIEASRNAGHEGVIEVDGRSCYASR